MRQIKIALEVCLEIFASWTLAFLLWLLLRLPAITVPIPFLLFLIPMIYASVRHWRQASAERLPSRRDLGSICALLLMSLVVGGLAVTAWRPDADDAGFFHRALVQITELNKPFLTNEALFDLPAASALTVLHHMTSYEMFLAMSARLFHLDPLLVFYVIAPFIAAALVPFTYYFLYRSFDIAGRVALAATLLAMLFLLIDGNTHRSFGNFAFVRLWQGKCVLVTLLLPASILQVRSFLDRPSRFGLFRITLIGLSGVGLSNAGVYLIPVLVTALSSAYVLVNRFSWPSIRRASVALTGVFFPLLVGAALITGILAGPKETSTFAWGFPVEWRQNLALVVDTRYTLIRDMVLICVPPMIGLKGRTRFFILASGLVLILLFANPVAGKFWLDHIYPASYWRLMYLIPLPWLFGLLAPAVAGGATYSKRALHIALSLVVLMAVLLALKSTVLYAVTWRPFHLERVVALRPPFSYNLPPGELNFARSVSGQLSGRVLLCPESISYVIGMVNPAVRFEAPRSDWTVYAFANLGLSDAGKRRVAALQLVGNCNQEVQDLSPLTSSLDVSNAIIIRDCSKTGDAQVSKTIEADSRWKQAYRRGDYILFLKQQ